MSTPEGHVEKLSLHAAWKALPRALVQHLEKGLLVSPASKAELKAAWTQRHAVYKHSSNPVRTIAQIDDVRDLSEIPQAEMEEVIRRVRRYPPYDTLKSELKAVRISRLVTPQLSVNLQRGIQLVPTAGAMTERQKFDIAFLPKRKPLKIDRTREPLGPWSTSEHFSIEDADVRVHLPPQMRALPLSLEDPQSDEAEALCFFVGRGTPFVAVHAIPTSTTTTRFVITNGIHRTYRWALRGEEWVPAVFVQGAGGPPTGQVADTTWGVLANPTTHMPLLGDFLRDDIAMRLTYRREVNRMTLKWEYEAHPDPLLESTDLDG